MDYLNTFCGKKDLIYFNVLKCSSFGAITMSQWKLLIQKTKKSCYYNIINITIAILLTLLQVHLPLLSL